MFGVKPQIGRVFFSPKGCNGRKKKDISLRIKKDFQAKKIAFKDFYKSITSIDSSIYAQQI